MRRQGIRRKQLPDDRKETKRCWKLKEEALDRTLWRTRVRRGCGRVVKADVRNECIQKQRKKGTKRKTE
jgi:hypothetical protein